MRALAQPGAAAGLWVYVCGGGGHAEEAADREMEGLHSVHMVPLLLQSSQHVVPDTMLGPSH